MTNQQYHEWVEAQNIVISTNLIVAAKKHLQFLEVVDKNGNLYDGAILEKAIFRYKYCWLPLLAEHADQSESRLVVPLDCEWIWHCHRLNPVRYMVDCIQLFGKILDPGCVVVSSIEGACKKQTEEIWKKKYPEEAYELDFNDHSFVTQSESTNLPSTNYDLISAVKRQSSFYHKVSGAIFRDDLYLEVAVERYKGFLHLVARNMEKKLNNPCVPTYDIDLIWHTHQLHPLSYCKDVIAIAGQVLHHDDTDTDQTKGGKLDVGVNTTTQQWAEMFGSAYWRVGSRPTSDMHEEHQTAMTAKCIVYIPVDNVKDEEHQTAMTAKCIVYIPVDNVKDEEHQTAMTAKCIVYIPVDNVKEKSTARCLCIPADNVKEKSTARCICIPAENVKEKLTARCLCIPADNVKEKSTARCLCIPADNVKEKLTARCLCIPADNVKEKLTARCLCIPADNVKEKSTARCLCVPADSMEGGDGSSARTARCWCLSEQVDGQKLIVESIASGAIKV